MRKFLFLLCLVACFGAKAMEESHDKNVDEQNEEDRRKEEHYWCQHRTPDRTQMLPTRFQKPVFSMLGHRVYECRKVVHVVRYCDEDGRMYRKLGPCAFIAEDEEGEEGLTHSPRLLTFKKTGRADE